MVLFQVHTFPWILKNSFPLYIEFLYIFLFVVACYASVILPGNLIKCEVRNNFPSMFLSRNLDTFSHSIQIRWNGLSSVTYLQLVGVVFQSNCSDSESPYSFSDSLFSWASQIKTRSSKSRFTNVFSLAHQKRALNRRSLQP